MSDSGESEKGKKRGVSSRFKLGKLSSKFDGLHNPFKRSNDSDSDNEDDAKVQPSVERKLPPITPEPNLSVPVLGTKPVPAGQELDTATAPISDTKPASSGLLSSAKALGGKMSSAVTSAPEKAASAVKSGAGQVTSVVAAVPAKATSTAKAVTSTVSRGEIPKEERKEEPAPVVDEPVDEVPVVGGPVRGTADVVLLGVKGQKENILQTLRERGFIVHVALLHEEAGTFTIAAGIGPKLLVKIALKINLLLKETNEYTCREMALLVGGAIKVLSRSDLEYSETVLLHNKEELARLTETKSNQAPDAVFSYYGSYVALYFAWLRFYTKSLQFPAAAGLLLCGVRLYTGTIDTVFMPAYCVLMAVWSTLFLELWKGTNSRIAFGWGVLGSEDEEETRVVAEKAGEAKSSPAGKYCVTVPIILLCIAFAVQAMLYCIWLSDNAIEVYGEGTWMQYWPMVVYSVVPITCAKIYSRIALILNNFENHPTEAKRKNMLVIKMFAFQFVNCYCSLMYIAFYLQDISRLRTMLMTLMVTKQVVFQFSEYYVPVLMRSLRERREKRKPPPEPKVLVAHSNTIGVEEMQAELKRDAVDIGDDYLEMVIQFGYISMFSVAFPLAPLLALLNNKVEFMLDLKMLVEGRRPPVHLQATIGSWWLCLQMIGVVSCLTNILIAVLVSDNVAQYVPSVWDHHLETIEGQILIAVVAEHLLLALKVIVAGMVDDMPLKVKEGQAVEHMKRVDEATKYRLMAHNIEISDQSLSGTSKRKGGGGTAARERAEAVKRMRQVHEDYDAWSFGPSWYLPLAAIPVAVAWFEVPLWLCMMLAVMMVSYLQHVKDKADTGVAMGIVTDAKVLKQVTSFLPAWYTDSEVERVEWINKILQKLWVPASGAVKEIVKTSVEPLLESYKPAGVTALGFRTVSLGSKAPKVVGARVLDMRKGMVVLEMEMRWASDAEVVLEAGVKPVPMVITLSKIRFSGKLRVELAPLVPVVPCFGAIMATFMEKPFVDFSFKLGKLDLMSLGPGDANIANVVTNLIKNIVSNMMLYPEKMVIPMMDDVDLQVLANPAPVGVLRVEMVGANDLTGADLMGKSDPYVKLYLGRREDSEQVTSVVKNTLKPRWGEIFDFLVYDPAVQSLVMEVFDEDPNPYADDTLGDCELPLSALKPEEEAAHNIPLSSTKSGSLLLKTMYIPLTSGSKEEEDEDDDVIIESLGTGVLTDDIVGNDKYSLKPAAAAPTPAGKDARSVTKADPQDIPPSNVIDPSDTSMGVMTVMGIQCKGVKPGKLYLAVQCGNNKRKTLKGEKQANFACDEVFHFLIKGARSSFVEVVLRNENLIGNDGERGSFKVRVAEVIANDDELEDEWVLGGDDVQGSVKMRFRWSGAKYSGPYDE